MSILFSYNLYPSKYFNSILRKYLSKKFKKYAPNYNVLKQIAYFNLPFIGSHTSKLISEVRTLFTWYFPQVTPSFYFRNINAIDRYISVT